MCQCLWGPKNRYCYVVPIKINRVAPNPKWSISFFGTRLKTCFVSHVFDHEVYLSMAAQQFVALCALMVLLHGPPCSFAAFVPCGPLAPLSLHRAAASCRRAGPRGGPACGGLYMQAPGAGSGADVRGQGQLTSEGVVDGRGVDEFFLRPGTSADIENIVACSMDAFYGQRALGGGKEDWLDLIKAFENPEGEPYVGVEYRAQRNRLLKRLTVRILPPIRTEVSWMKTCLKGSSPQPSTLNPQPEDSQP